jgi:imidazoleglycerol phosphate dehydratase HisB
MLLIRQVECCNLQAASIPNSTGIGFFDHMLDQFHSHAQVGVGIHVTILNGEEATHVDATTPLESLEGMIQHHNRLAVMNTTTTSQEELMRLVGRALGAALRPLLQQVPSGQASRFCCPLDEALVECILQTLPPKDDNNAITSSSSSIFVYDLAPYGSYPSTGRSHIGYMETQPLQPFWQELFISSGLYQFQLRKVRGDNAHHIVESSFKAVARALRNLLDQCHTTMDITSPNSIMMTIMWDDMDSDNYKASAALDRQAKSERKTKETTIAVQVHLTPRDHLLPPNVQTGVDVLDQFLSHLACHAQMNLTCTCQGDVWVDEHHTSEDVAITLGQVLYEALGTKAGLNRMWCAQGTCGGTYEHDNTTTIWSHKPSFMI